MTSPLPSLVRPSIMVPAEPLILSMHRVCASSEQIQCLAQFPDSKESRVGNNSRAWYLTLCLRRSCKAASVREKCSHMVGDWSVRARPSIPLNSRFGPGRKGQTKQKETTADATPRHQNLVSTASRWPKSLQNRGEITQGGPPPPVYCVCLGTYRNSIFSRQSPWTQRLADHSIRRSRMLRPGCKTALIQAMPSHRRQQRNPQPHSRARL